MIYNCKYNKRYKTRCPKCALSFGLSGEHIKRHIQPNLPEHEGYIRYTISRILKAIAEGKAFWAFSSDLPVDKEMIGSLKCRKNSLAMKPIEQAGYFEQKYMGMQR